MSIHTHLQSLADKRNLIKQRIAEETNHPAPDLALISTLKKQNLVLKEEMQRYLSLLSKESATSS